MSPSCREEGFQTAGSNLAAAKSLVSFRTGPANPERRLQPNRSHGANPRGSVSCCKPNITNVIKVCKTALINNVDDYLEQ